MRLRQECGQLRANQAAMAAQARAVAAQLAHSALLQMPLMTSNMNFCLQDHAELVRLRRECGELRAEQADMAAQARAAAAQLAAALAEAAALRQENLELAAELNEASKDRHATEDAHHLLRERCSVLQVR